MRNAMLIVVVCSFFICCNGDRTGIYSQSEALDCYDRKLSSPKHWERILFSYIAKRVRETNLKCLEDDGSVSDEVRIWIGFSTSPLRGIILRPEQEGWSALFIPPLSRGSGSSMPVVLPPPHSGWRSLLQNLEKLDIYTLPDSVDIGADNSYPDAEAIVVETKSKGSYRAYMYNGFEGIKAPETTKVLEICKTLQSEFDLELGCG